MIFLVTNLCIKLELYYSDKDIYSWRTIEINIPSGKLEGNDNLFAVQGIENYYIYKNHYEGNKNIKGIFFGDTDHLLMKSGSIHDLNSFTNERKAIIGSNVKKDVYRVKGKLFILVEGKEFEVLGMLDKKHDKWLKNTIVIPLFTAIELYGIEGQYYVDGSAEGIMQIIKKLKDVGINEITDIELNIFPSLFEFYRINNDILRVYLILFVSLILLLVISIEFYIRNFSQEYKVYMYMGISYKKLFWRVGGLYLKLLVFSNIVSLIITGVILKVFDGQKVYLFGGIITFLIDLLVLFLNIIKKIRRAKKEIWK